MRFNCVDFMAIVALAVDVSCGAANRYVDGSGGMVATNGNSVAEVHRDQAGILIGNLVTNVLPALNRYVEVRVLYLMGALPNRISDDELQKKVGECMLSDNAIKSHCETILTSLFDGGEDADYVPRALANEVDDLKAGVWVVWKDRIIKPSCRSYDSIINEGVADSVRLEHAVLCRYYQLKYSKEIITQFVARSRIAGVDDDRLKIVLRLITCHSNTTGP